MNQPFWILWFWHQNHIISIINNPWIVPGPPTEKIKNTPLPLPPAKNLEKRRTFRLNFPLAEVLQVICFRFPAKLLLQMYTMRVYPSKYFTRNGKGRVQYQSIKKTVCAWRPLCLLKNNGKLMIWNAGDLYDRRWNWDKDAVREVTVAVEAANTI